MNFHDFQELVAKQFATMKNHPLYKVDVSKDQLWDTYLNSFPPGSNPMFRERTAHDCQCCKQFIRLMGNVVCYHDGIRTSIWEMGILSDDPVIKAVSTAMHNLVADLNVPLRAPFYHFEKTAGTKLSHGHSPDGDIEEWEHFFLELPASVVKRSDQIPTLISKRSSSRQVFARALDDISIDSLDTVIELIQQGSLYRGQEHMHVLEKFRACKIVHNDMQGSEAHEYWLWHVADTADQSVVRIRNSAIGTLLVDMSEGKSLDAAVGAFEAMVAPTNYKRPTALITPTMIKKAQETVEELGFSEALQRRHATVEDVRVNNVLYVSRSVQKLLQGNDPFAELMAGTTVNMKSLEKVEEVQIEDFIKDILPKAEKLEILMENQHEGNLMSLIAPANPDAKNMLKWKNNFSWTYKGEIADSMKENVKAAGGKVDGVIRFSIQWNVGEIYNTCDYDAHCQEPAGSGIRGVHNTIYYMNHHNPKTSGDLDVDITHPIRNKPAVENITWSQEGKMVAGVYTFLVHNFSARQGNNGFSAELEYNGEIRSYEYNKPLRQSEKVIVATVDFIPFKGMTVIKELPSTVASKEVWGVSTMQFQEVTLMMHSPNHWDGEETGNKHYFFIIGGCKQPGEIRGFFNEFLTDKLREHRKVFEVLGSKMRVPESDNQLSGLGFSSTQRNHAFVKVTGSFTRTLKVIF